MTPQLIAAGSAGGTVITSKFKDLSINTAVGEWLMISTGKIARNPMIAIIAIIKTNFIPS
jgi:hypothetical protein